MKKFLIVCLFALPVLNASSDFIDGVFSNFGCENGTFQAWSWSEKYDSNGKRVYSNGEQIVVEIKNGKVTKCDRTLFDLNGKDALNTNSFGFFRNEIQIFKNDQMLSQNNSPLIEEVMDDKVENPVDFAYSVEKESVSQNLLTKIGTTAFYGIKAIFTGVFSLISGVFETIYDIFC